MEEQNKKRGDEEADPATRSSRFLVPDPMEACHRQWGRVCKRSHLEYDPSQMIPAYYRNEQPKRPVGIEDDEAVNSLYGEMDSRE